MGPGLTFGTITSLYRLQSGIIDRTQFSLLISVVVLSAIIPTAIAQRFSQPRAVAPGPAGAVSSMPFERILVAIDGSRGANRHDRQVA